MTAFVIVAAVLVAVALAWVLPPLLRRSTPPAVARASANLSIFQDQFAELEADLKGGAITDERYQQARQELERRLLEEAAADTEPAEPSRRHGPWPAIALALLIPLGAGALYWKFGSPDALEATSLEADPHMKREHVDAMVNRLLERLEKSPDDLNGWFTLARTYYATGRYDAAVGAFEKIVAKVPDDADLLADYADALAMAQGRKIAGKPMELIQRALKIDPTQWKALAMAGTEAFDRQDYREALRYWERLQASVPPESDVARSIANSIAEARSRGGIKDKPAPPAAAARESTAKPVVAGGAVQGMVTLAPALAAKAAPTDTVLVFARAAEGPKMPLAIVTAQVKDLPLKFKLDDTMAMTPEMKLSAFPEVVVGARISKTRGATAQSGDLQGLSKPVKTGAAEVSVIIDSVIP